MNVTSSNTVSRCRMWVPPEIRTPSLQHARPESPCLFRRSQFDHGQFVRMMWRSQRCKFPELSQAAAAPKDLRATHDPCTRQRPLSSRITLPRFCAATLEICRLLFLPPTPATAPIERVGNWPVAWRRTTPTSQRFSKCSSRQRLLRSLAPTEHSVAPLMLHYLGRCV